MTNALTVDAYSLMRASQRHAGPAAFLSGFCMLTVTGLSSEAQTVRVITHDVAQSYLSVLSVPLPLEYEFAARVAEWKADTRFISSPEIAAGHPAYQRIIGLGRQVIPLILLEMEREPGLWFDALMALTDAQPVPLEHAGDIDAMTTDWLAWGRQNGFLES